MIVVLLYVYVFIFSLLLRLIGMVRRFVVGVEASISVAALTTVNYTLLVITLTCHYYNDAPWALLFDN